MLNIYNLFHFSENLCCSSESFIKMQIITVYILEIQYSIGDVHLYMIYINTSNFVYSGFALDDLKKEH